MGRGFAVGGGVAAAVVEAIQHMDPDREVPIEYGDGLRECRKMLMMAKAGKRNGYLLEGMACPGGCVAGAGTIQPVKQSAASVEKFKKPGGGEEHHRQPLPGPPPGRGGAVKHRCLSKKQQGRPTGRPWSSYGFVRGGAHSWYSSTISGMVPMHSSVVITLMALA